MFARLLGSALILPSSHLGIPDGNSDLDIDIGNDNSDMLEDFADAGLMHENIDFNTAQSSSSKMPKKYKRKGGHKQSDDEEMRILLEDSQGLVGLGQPGRRSRRMRAIEPNRDIVVLFPDDDPISTNLPEPRSCITSHNIDTCSTCTQPKTHNVKQWVLY